MLPVSLTEICEFSVFKELAKTLLNRFSSGLGWIRRLRLGSTFYASFIEFIAAFSER